MHFVSSNEVVHLFVSVLRGHRLHGRELVCRHHLMGAGMNVLNSAPSFHNQRKDFLPLRCTQSKRECASAQVFPLAKNPDGPLCH